ncbi:CsbD family protein [Caballeronia sp. LP006]|uniref:CsbD family protein n=1 Tax=unclassified Caballeronia TaxID=2646786 RepID=UPI001FCFACA6|nr:MULTISPECIES: CsbD family protein [unclassified Caballeronia]MDR5775153.1 CsbD family protein [Caballeronia sp. LZ002]MDR5800855.1 CsbD family protein [Caballeronia sp. LZ001]MDR5829057.1 CsbD family protein [Caballeronia sp. LP006]MDR5850591.1 CsbD family protein [Caballeronia sp. LZ003]
MVQDQVEGAAQQVVGKVQDAVGALTGDSETQVAGKTRQALGSLQQSYGETVDQLRVAVASQPINGLLIAATVGFVLGALWNRDR